MFRGMALKNDAGGKRTFIANGYIQYDAIDLDYKILSSKLFVTERYVHM